MPTWIRFRYENGDTVLVNAEETHFLFKSEDSLIEVLPTRPEELSGGGYAPICLYKCEFPDQVAAAEEMIFDALARQQSITITLDSLDDHAEYLNHVQGIRMVLSLIHQGSIRIPKDEELQDKNELFEPEDITSQSEISRFESMLHTYLDVPDDVLRKAYNRAFNEVHEESPFGIKKDHEECPDHGFHEYWVVETMPDSNYSFRSIYTDLAKTLENEGLSWNEPRLHA